jgi:exopolyphosphatase / guanosine-5'-triphosphate,3'-diphosphate pyrophosphatase
VLPDPAATMLIGTAGTATTLAAIDLGMTEYDYRKVNNHVMSRGTGQQILERLLPLSPVERLSVPGLEKGREDLIIAGAIIATETMDTFGFCELTVSDYGLLEGVALSIASGYHAPA